MMHSGASLGLRSSLLAMAITSFTATFAQAPFVHAATTYYVSPDGAADAICTRETPCALATGASTAKAGDFVVLLDGTYSNQQLTPANSGTSSAWITFQADDGALPILNGPGGTTESTGVGSDVATYVRFIGIAVKNWASGFANAWIANSDAGTYDGNGHWQYINCIADGNSRNGMVFNSATGILMHQNIIAHNGTSADHSWSSGVQLYAVNGTSSDNIVEQCVAFENMDNQKHTDGSGFIVDTNVKGASFINNIAFLNGGSGLRLTKSANIVIINNTFYHNGRDTADTGPGNPGEIYFTDGKSTTLTMVNNVGVASGTTQDPSSAWVWNGGSVTIPATNVTSGAFADADGTHPDFHLTTSSTTLIDKGDSANAPAVDNGFDPKCITKGKPTDIVCPSWSAYSVDYAYIKKIGGVAKCWAPGTRPANSKYDIGAYEYNATAAPTGTGGSLPPQPVSGQGGVTGSGGGTGSGGVSGSGGISGNGGSFGNIDGSVDSAQGTGGASGGSTGGGGSSASGGASGAGSSASGGKSGSGGSGSGGKNGSGGKSGSGGNSSNGGAVGDGRGGSLASGGETGSNSGGSSGSGGAVASGGSSGKGGNNSSGGQSASGNSSSGCSLAGSQSSGGAIFFFGLIVGLFALRSRSRNK